MARLWTPGRPKTWRTSSPRRASTTHSPPVRNSGRLLARALRDGEAGLLPRGEPAVHLVDGLESHLLRDVGGQRRSPGAVAVEDKGLAGREDVLVIGALRIDPELEHAAGAVKRTGDHALPLQLADVSQIHEHGVALVVPRASFVEAERGDPGLRLVDHLSEALFELHRVCPREKGVAPRAGLEPATPRLTAGCSTIELSGIASS